MPFYCLQLKPNTDRSYLIHNVTCEAAPKLENRIELDVQISARDALMFAKMRFVDKRDNIKLCVRCCIEENATGCP